MHKGLAAAAATRREGWAERSGTYVHHGQQDRLENGGYPSIEANQQHNRLQLPDMATT